MYGSAEITVEIELLELSKTKATISVAIGKDSDRIGLPEESEKAVITLKKGHIAGIPIDISVSAEHGGEKIIVWDEVGKVVDEV